MATALDSLPDERAAALWRRLMFRLWEAGGVEAVNAFTIMIHEDNKQADDEFAAMLNGGWGSKITGPTPPRLPPGVTRPSGPSLNSKARHEARKKENAGIVAERQEIIKRGYDGYD